VLTRDFLSGLLTDMNINVGDGGRAEIPVTTATAIYIIHIVTITFTRDLFKEEDGKEIAVI